MQMGQHVGQQVEPSRIFSPQTQVIQPVASNLKAEEANDGEVNLDGISDRGNYGMHESFKLENKYSTFNHMGPGEPVPF